MSNPKTLSEELFGKEEIGISDNMPQVAYNGKLEKLAKQYRESALTIKQLENQLKDAKAVKTELETVTLPSAMAETGFSSVTLPSGTKITVSTVHKIRLAKEADGKTVDEDKRNKFYEWLVENGYEGLIKSMFVLYTNEAEVIDALKQVCKEQNIEFEYIIKAIPWRTLEAWYKEQVQQGVELPTHLFESYDGSIAVVK